MPVWYIIMVWWEDLLFCVPVFYLSENSKLNKYLKFSLIFAISLLFGLGHGYQGVSGILVTSLYPYFISTHYAKRYGFGTVMVCHVLYDMITVAMIRLAPYILS